MAPDARVILLEPVNQIDEEEIRTKLSAAGIKGISISDVTEECLAAQTEFFQDRNLKEEPLSKKYALITGHF